MTTPDGILVTGSGVADAPVTRVTLSLAVVEWHNSAAEAFRAAGDSVTRLLSVLADDGVDSRSVRTTDLSLGPRTSYVQDRERVIGYQARQALVARMSGLAGLEQLLGDIATVGNACRIEGLTLDAEDPVAADLQARDNAMADARAKAGQLAALSDRALGQVRSVRELRDFAGPMPVRRTARGAFSAMPVAAGPTDIRVDLEVHFDFA